MITIDALRKQPSLGADERLPLAPGKILVASPFGGVEAVIARPPKPKPSGFVFKSKA